MSTVTRTAMIMNTPIRMITGITTITIITMRTTTATNINMAVIMMRRSMYMTTTISMMSKMDTAMAMTTITDTTMCTGISPTSGPS